MVRGQKTASRSRSHNCRIRIWRSNTPPCLKSNCLVLLVASSMITSGMLLLIVHGLLIPLLVRNTPQQLGLTPNRSDQEESVNNRSDDLVGMTVGSAIRTPAFWIAAAGLFLFYGGQTLSSLIIDFFSTAGLSFSALAIAITAWIRTGLRIPLGLSMARIDRVFLLSSLVCLSQGLGVFALLFAPNRTTITSLDTPLGYWRLICSDGRSFDHHQAFWCEALWRRLWCNTGNRLLRANGCPNTGGSTVRFSGRLLLKLYDLLHLFCVRSNSLCHLKNSENY